VDGSLPENVMHFARVLRRAGLPIGPGKVLVALRALQSISLARRDDVYWALHCTFVERHAQSEMFDLAFRRFWRRTDTAAGEAMPSIVDQLTDHAAVDQDAPVPRRIAEAFDNVACAVAADGAFDMPDETMEAVASWSATERLRHQDFESMSRDELAEAARLMTQMRISIPSVPTRRFRPARTGTRVDMRATFRDMVRTGGGVRIARKTVRRRHPPLVVLCDISGSMATYSRMLLRFLHALTNDRDRVHVFLFGTRLSNITRDLAHRDPDIALSRVGRSVEDWGGGTRIGPSLAAFNRLWSRRVLGQGAAVVLISDGLDRDGGSGLAHEMERLRKSCRRLIWLNPLLRYAGFEPKSAGIKAMLPHVDEFRPAHNLDSLTALVSALSAKPITGKRRFHRDAGPHHHVGT
jgi:uncharacterized protein with von Willebrand factor type A (vWA) domain